MRPVFQEDATKILSTDLSSAWPSPPKGDRFSTSQRHGKALAVTTAPLLCILLPCPLFAGLRTTVLHVESHGLAAASFSGLTIPVGGSAHDVTCGSSVPLLQPSTAMLRTSWARSPVCAAVRMHGQMQEPPCPGPAAAHGMPASWCVLELLRACLISLSSQPV